MSIDHTALICGEASKGKSASLRHLKNVLMANCEAGKKLPFKQSEFNSFTVTHPGEIEGFFAALESNDAYECGVIDGLNYLMEMFVSVIIRNSTDSRSEWGNYAEFLRNMMQQYVASSTKPILFTAHTRTIYNEANMSMETKVPIQGSLANIGVESYFTTVVAAKVLPIEQLKEYVEGNGLLTITDDEMQDGYKHVFQTRLTAATVNERIRAPMGMFNRAETYMDNDAALLLQRLNEYYED